MRREGDPKGFKSLTAQALTYWPHPSSDVRVMMWYADFGATGQWGLFDSAVDGEMPRYLARAAGLALEERPPQLPNGVPDDVQAIWWAADKSSLDELLGVMAYDEQGKEVHWRMGLAGLDRHEAAALRMQIEQRFSVKEIAQHMAPRRARFGDHLPLETVETYLKRARRKLRELFGAPEAPGGTFQLTTSTTHSNPSTGSPDASGSITRQPRISPRTPLFATSSGQA